MNRTHLIRPLAQLALHPGAPRRWPRRQHGAATLVVTLVLLLALALLTGQAHRGLLMEQRSSANQWQATQAFEAAEAGLAWAQAQLNRSGRIDNACLASTAPGQASPDNSFADRLLAWQAQPPGLRVRQRPSPASQTQALPLRAACAALADGSWRCDCPSQAEPSWPTPADDTARPGFTVQFSDGPVLGTLQLRAIGCHEAGPACDPDAPATGASRAELTQLLGLLPALLRAPAAPLTARQDIQAGSASVGLFNTEPEGGGLLAHAGGAIALDGARLQTVAGEPGALALAANDAPLAALSPDALFITHFGLDPDRWRQLPGVRTLSCAGDCGGDLRQATADGHTLLHLQGDAQLSGPLTVGTAERPVLIVVTGTAQLSGAVQLHGLLHARAIEWRSGPGPGAGRVHGALISAGSYTGNGAPDLVWDRAVLDMLRHRWGTWVPVPGGWRDH